MLVLVLSFNRIIVASGGVVLVLMVRTRGLHRGWRDLVYRTYHKRGSVSRIPSALGASRTWLLDDVTGREPSVRHLTEILQGERVLLDLHLLR